MDQHWNLRCRQSSNFYCTRKQLSGKKCKNTEPYGPDSTYDATNSANSNSSVFVKNTLHSLFSDCSTTTNRMEFSSPNRNYAHKASIETEISQNNETKDTWLKCQGYTYAENAINFSTAPFTAREGQTTRSMVIKFIGDVAADVFTCERRLLKGVISTLKISPLKTERK